MVKGMTAKCELCTRKLQIASYEILAKNPMRELI